MYIIIIPIWCIYYVIILDIFKNRGGEITKMNFFNIMVVGFLEIELLSKFPKYF